MATLNLKDPNSIIGKTTAVALSGTTATAVLSNAASSGVINRVTSINVSNSSTSAAATVTLNYYSGAALGGTAYPIVSTVSIPASSSLPLLDALTQVYLPDGTSIGATAGTGGVLTVVCAYEQIASAEVPAPPGPQPGQLWAWGNGSQYGQLGLNDRVDRSSPTQVGTGATWTKISTIPASLARAVLARKSDGTLWAWGRNANGQLGLNDRIDRSSPVQIGALTNWSSQFQASQGGWAIKTDGTLWSWGTNASGQLGQNDRIYRSSPTQIGADTNWSIVTQNAAIKTNGALWVWGGNYFGGLGQNNLIKRSSPVQVGAGTTWANIVYAYSAFATKTDGTLWAWGYGGYGTLGDGTTVNRSSPVQIGALTNWSTSGQTLAKIGSTGKAIKADGSLWVWGYNGTGIHGTNNRINRSSPVQMGSDTNWSAVTGYLMLKSTGSLWSVGPNPWGQLGQNDIVNRSSPVQIGALTTWQAIGGAGTAFGIKTA